MGNDRKETEMIRERIEKLRKKMREAGVSVYVIPSSDCHGSEYVGEHFRAREYMSGFTGSAGTLVVTLLEAGLWTDGRYFLQAERQLLGSGICLYRTGEDGVQRMEDFVEERLSHEGMLGFDGRTMGAYQAEVLVKRAEAKKREVLLTRDLVGEIWKERPKIAGKNVWILKECYVGESAESKIKRVREKMKEEGADVCVLAALCDIAWLLNIRGEDIPCVPVVMSYLCMKINSCKWYVRKEVVPEEVRKYIEGYGVEILEYEDIYQDLEKIEKGQQVWVDKKNVNYRLLSSLREVKIIDKPNPTELMKAVKNPTEIQNLREAHRKEGIALTKFMYWVKNRVREERITELSAAAYLKDRRAEQGNYMGDSFASICAYGAHGAVVHYEATKESDVRVKEGAFFLVDTGGHYLEGTTDTTRTFVLGEVSKEQKRMYTAVLRGNLHLAYAKFLSGCTGYSLDVLCREPLWQMGMDYKHGTGHGVGYYLSVHEGPNAFRWKLPEYEKAAVLEAGMVTTDEPGVYIEGEYGIRIENELLCVEAAKNEYGQFMEFEILTLTPIDLDGVLIEEMTKTERGWLNHYHQKVYRELSPYLKNEERAWLKKYTREI